MKSFKQFIQTKLDEAAPLPIVNPEDAKSSRQWRDAKTRLRGQSDLSWWLDGFLELPDKEKIFKKLSTLGDARTLAPYSMADKETVIYGPLKKKFPDAFYNHSDLILGAHTEAIRFKGDFDKFIQALHDPLFVSYDNSLAYALGTNQWPNDLSDSSFAKAIGKQIKDSERIPATFFTKAMRLLRSGSGMVGGEEYSDDDLVDFFNQPLQQQLSKIRSIRKDSDRPAPFGGALGHDEPAQWPQFGGKQWRRPDKSHYGLKRDPPARGSSGQPEPIFPDTGHF